MQAVQCCCAAVTDPLVCLKAPTPLLVMGIHPWYMRETSLVLLFVAGVGHSCTW